MASTVSQAFRFRSLESFSRSCKIVASVLDDELLDDELLDDELLDDDELLLIALNSNELELPELDVELSSTITASTLLLLESLAALCPGPFLMSCCTAAKAVCAAERLPELSAVPRAAMSLSIWLSPLVLDVLDVVLVDPVCWSCSLTMAL